MHTTLLNIGSGQFFLLHEGGGIYFSYIMAVNLLVEESEVPGENHRPAASHWQASSHNIVLSAPRHERDSIHSKSQR